MEVSGATTQAQYTVNSLSRGVGEGRGEGSYGPVLSQRRSGTSHFLLADALGTTTRLLDPSENVTDTYVMDAFGDPVATSGSSVNPFRYVGGLGYYSEGDPALSYVRSRWLRPTTGSWLSVDPVEGEPRYVYVNGSPVNATDGGGRQRTCTALPDQQDGYDECDYSCSISRTPCGHRRPKQPQWPPAQPAQPPRPRAHRRVFPRPDEIVPTLEIIGGWIGDAHDAASAEYARSMSERSRILEAGREELYSEAYPRMGTCLAWIVLAVWLCESTPPWCRFLLGRAWEACADYLDYVLEESNPS
jgi:RHS repeat-associated protein